jgi:hypothetical protein
MTTSQVAERLAEEVCQAGGELSLRLRRVTESFGVEKRDRGPNQMMTRALRAVGIESDPLLGKPHSLDEKVTLRMSEEELRGREPAKAVATLSEDRGTLCLGFPVDRSPAGRTLRAGPLEVILTDEPEPRIREVRIRRAYRVVPRLAELAMTLRQGEDQDICL